MFIFIVRSALLYIILLFLVRLMGKRQIGELQPFEFILTLMLADVATLPLQETGLSLINGIAPLFTLGFLHLVISFISRKSFVLRKFFDGTPVIIINPSGIQYKKLKTLNMNITDLQESLRSQGYFSFNEVEYAIVESNGQISVLPKSTYKPLTAKDINLNLQQAELDVALIIDGKVMGQNLQKLNLGEIFLVKYLKKAKVENIKDLLLVTVSTNGDMYIQPKKGKYKTVKTSFKGGELR